LSHFGFTPQHPLTDDTASHLHPATGAWSAWDWLARCLYSHLIATRIAFLRCGRAHRLVHHLSTPTRCRDPLLPACTCCSHILLASVSPTCCTASLDDFFEHGLQHKFHPRAVLLPSMCFRAWTAAPSSWWSKEITKTYKGTYGMPPFEKCQRDKLV
jgi:hypothetical protein